MLDSDFKDYAAMPSFQIWQASYLWIGLLPPTKQGEMPAAVSQVAQSIIKTWSSIDPLWITPDRNNKYLENRLACPLTRKQLETIAVKLGDFPQFLFPSPTASSSPKPSNEIHGKSRNTYLKVIKALLNKLGENEPDRRGLASEIRRMTEMTENTENTVSEEFIRQMLKDIHAYID